MVGAQNLKFVLVFMVVLHSRCCISQRNVLCGGCGVYAVCDPQHSPICTCLPGFDPLNPGNWSSGCRRRASLDCEKSGADGFLKLQIMMNTQNTSFSEHWFGPADGCKARCLSNCSCLAYGYLYGSECVLWSGTLIDIQKLSTGSTSEIYIRVSNSELGNLKFHVSVVYMVLVLLVKRVFVVTDQKKGPKKMIIIILAVVGLVVLSIIAYFSWRWISKTKHVEHGSAVDSSVQLALSQVNVQDFPLFEFETLAKATNNFSEANKLGKGGFGPVYKGKLANGREIAVKRLSQTSGQGIQEFMNEVVLITKLQHRNLVRLLGCCVEVKEMMLIYEYLPNKSLNFFLFDPSLDILDWRKRLNIIEGICRGLLYLHRDSRLRIIHRDLKPSNILLDNDWNPKISDFGMARIYGTKQDHVSTLTVVGTYGYMAPEYAIKGRFSEKSDVFSFGVLVLEIATGRRNSSFKHQDEPSLMAHVWNMWTEGNVVGSIDPRILSPENEAEVIRCMHIGLLCVQELPRDRPSVSCVLSMLGSEVVELPKPKQCAFTRNWGHTTTSSSQQSQKSSCSLNNVSITMVDGR